MLLEQSGAAGAASPFPSPLAAPIGEGDGMHRVKATSFADYKLIRRNGSVVAFEPGKITVFFASGRRVLVQSKAGVASGKLERPKLPFDHSNTAGGKPVGES